MHGYVRRMMETRMEQEMEDQVSAGLEVEGF